jgi:hypothetical protein
MSKASKKKCCKFGEPFVRIARDRIKRILSFIQASDKSDAHPDGLGLEEKGTPYVGRGGWRRTVIDARG